MWSQPHHPHCCQMILVWFLGMHKSDPSLQCNTDHMMQWCFDVVFAEDYCKLASVAVEISYVGPLGGKQSLLTYPSGPSQPQPFLKSSYPIQWKNIVILLVRLLLLCKFAVVVKINYLSFFLSFFTLHSTRDHTTAVWLMWSYNYINSRDQHLLLWLFPGCPSHSQP